MSIIMSGSSSPHVRRSLSSVSASAPAATSLSAFCPRLLLQLLDEWTEQRSSASIAPLPRHSFPDDETTAASLSKPPLSPTASLDSACPRSIRGATLSDRARKDSDESSDASLGPVVFPFSSELYAVILFIDVSGFTALTESFVRAGPHGLEELTAVMNSYFSSILNVIQQYGGDLLKVAGDALIAAFYLPGAKTKQPLARSSDPIEHCRSALCSNVVSCAVQLQRSCGVFRAASHSLRLHIAVTAGPTHFIAVGGAEQSWPGQQSDGRRWEFLAAGPALHDLSSTVQQSEAGEVVVSGAVWAECTRSSQFNSPSSAIDGSDNRKLILEQSPFVEQPISAAAEAAELEATLTAVCDPFPRTPLTPSCSNDISTASFLMPALLCRVPSSSTRTNHSVCSSPHSYGTSIKSLNSPRYSPASTPSSTPRMSAVRGDSPPSIPQRALSLASGGERSAASGSAANDWLAEYRRVSVLFIQLPHPDSCTEESDVTPQAEACECSTQCRPSWLLGFHSLFSSVQQCVFDMGGQVRQLLVDDKGCVCIAVFGLSPLTHENDAARAVAASIHIMSRLDKAGYGVCRPAQRSPLTIGISTGRAYTGVSWRRA